MSDAISVAIIGCGKMGTAILQGLLRERRGPSKATVRISQIKISVRRKEHFETLQNLLVLMGKAAEHPFDMPVSIHMQDQNSKLVQQCDVVIVACKPTIFRTLFDEPGFRQALLHSAKAKVLVTIMGGVSTHQIELALHAPTSQLEHSMTAGQNAESVSIIRVIPNIAARVGQSMTIIAAPSRESVVAETEKITQLFSLVGQTIQVPESQFNVASALASSSIAFYAEIIKACASGAQASAKDEGISEKDCVAISAQAAKGAACLAIDGKDLSEVVGKVATKGGSTAIGLQVMIEGKISSVMAEAISKCAIATGKLSQGAD